jgi:hypothetical protein
MTTPEVGVLLPMRLETRFLDRGLKQGWALRVRVVPDAVSISNHDETPSEFELDSVEAMWRQVGSANLESAKGRAAWRALARLVGPETAAYLARTFPPVTLPNGDIIITRPQQLRTGMHTPQLHGLTPTMELWLARGGQSPGLAATLTPIISDIDLDLDDPDSTKQPWWTSFAEAVRVGMAAELDLGTAFPDDIDALYLVGIGGGDPGALLAAQADSGRLGMIPPGSATNSVDGEPTISFGDDDAWRRLVRVRASQQPGANALRLALAAPASLPGVVGGESSHREVNSNLVRALWPALWGHSLGNVWGNGSRTDDLGVWAAQNLVPEGPLPTLRIDSQPYGLLPATSLRRWARASGDPTIEDQLIPLVRELVDQWAATAERLAASGTDSLHQLVRNPNATAYAWRWMMPTELAAAVSFRYADPIARTDINGWWDQRSPTTQLSPGATPARRLVATGWAREVGIGLARPTDLAEGADLSASLTQLAGATVSDLIAAGPTSTGPGHPPWGRSVLTELARHALLTSAATVARSAAGQQRALVEPVSADARSATQTEIWASRLQDTDLRRSGDPAVTVHTDARAALGALAAHPSDEIERALQALLDTAADRIDPWATAIAWRRLQSLAAAPRTLGAYGWVDAPRPRHGTTDHRFVLAPSRDQANVAAMMRDRAVSDPDAAAWAADLTSDAVRAALRLAGEVRDGSHPAEALGRMVERIVVRPDVTDNLRDAFPLTLGIGPGLDPGPRQIRIRRSCNGVAVLDAAKSDPARLQNLGVRPQQLAAILQLAAAVDALADLHVAEGALGLVQHRPSLVSASTSAAAGESPPPRFTFPDTPRTGVAVDSIAVIALPAAPPPTGRSPSPAALADPAVAAYLDERGGPASGAQWTWTRVDAAGQPAGPVTLADIGLRPCDTVGLAPQNLRDVIMTASGAPALEPDEPDGPAVVRTLAAAIAGVPASTADVGATADSTDAVAAELAARYAAVYATAINAVADARAAAGSPAGAERRELARLARWGISPMSAETSGGIALSDRLAGAADVLERRLSALPPDLTGAPVGDLVASITALVGPEAGYPIFGRLPAASFAGIRAEPVRAGQAPRLDPDWLEVVAAVRPALTRLEAAQLGERIRAGGRPLRAWTSKPGDPWQTAAVAAGGTGPAGRLIAVFGPEGVLRSRPTSTTAGTVAAAVIDRFAETIPDTEHTASVAFPHDIPTARAPQAVLLAVPPAVDQPLTTDVLVDIVAETRDLTRARMTGAADVGATGSALHLAALPAAGRAGVDFEGSP